MKGWVSYHLRMKLAFIIRSYCEEVLITSISNIQTVIHSLVELINQKKHTKWALKYMKGGKKYLGTCKGGDPVVKSGVVWFSKEVWTQKLLER